MLLSVVVALLLIAAGIAANAMRRLTAARVELLQLAERQRRFEQQLPRGGTPRSVDVTGLRRDADRALIALEGERIREVLAHLLADCRDAMGAEEAILWCWTDNADAMRPEDWSTEGSRPAFFERDAWGPLVAWASDEQTLQLAAEGDLVFAAAAPIILDNSCYGVLSVTSRSGLARPRAEVKQWLPRLATQVGYVRELVAARLDYARHLQRRNAVVKALKRLESAPSGDGLARSLCETALLATGARGAVLVHWSSEADTGTIDCCTEGVGLRAPAPLGHDSQVAEQCRRGVPLVLEDARGRSTAHALYGMGRTVRDPGSLVILPIVRQGRVLGALVLEADDVLFFAHDTGEDLLELLQVAAGSLELAWSYGEADLRSRTDRLTGLYNRAHFDEQLEKQIALADRYGPVSLVMVDIDHFKRVNDSFGHEAGDAVLRRVAGLIQEAARSTDICVRYGGEEIALLLPQTGQAAARLMAERLRERIAATVAFHKGAAIPVTASFGVATYPETVTDSEKLFPQADEALYRAKAEGRNCVRYADIKLHTSTS
ncbi:MAG TPA: sensor domain-containing diguanylate cyclase [Gemmatimonadaceae bacterium]|nr:sensor domain-containing diguanylate cyclase [Gemmatimonadaceae bacterium]